MILAMSGRPDLILRRRGEEKVTFSGCFSRSKFEESFTLVGREDADEDIGVFSVPKRGRAVDED